MVLLLYVNPQTPNQNPVPTSFTQRHAWRRSSYFCDQTTINSGGLIGAAVPCTDFSVSQDMSAGQSSTIINFPPNIMVALSFTGGA
ncbi:unnamed protein product [Rotaria socialis]|uniref:Uncharacterized protein n=1 Tax=Rotaria socialis TaxID=392032 RepID=A0A818CBE3_9BILA|nr:unnamed protein product [Rotaria socialis]